MCSDLDDEPTKEVPALSSAQLASEYAAEWAQLEVQARIYAAMLKPPREGSGDGR
jgi:hypothetical protein